MKTKHVRRLELLFLPPPDRLSARDAEIACELANDLIKVAPRCSSAAIKACELIAEFGLEVEL